MALTIRNPKRIQAKSRQHAVREVGKNLFVVHSGRSGNAYRVELFKSEAGIGGRCGCEWGAHTSKKDHHRSACSHVLAVLRHVASVNRRSPRVSAWGSLDEAARQRRPVTNIGNGVIVTGVKPVEIIAALSKIQRIDRSVSERL